MAVQYEFLKSKLRLLLYLIYTRSISTVPYYPPLFYLSKPSACSIKKMSEGGIFGTKDFDGCVTAAKEYKSAEAVKELWKLILDSWFPENEAYTVKDIPPTLVSFQTPNASAWQVSKNGAPEGQQITFIVICQMKGPTTEEDDRICAKATLKSTPFSRYRNYSALYGACAVGSEVELYKWEFNSTGKGEPGKLEQIRECKKGLEEPSEQSRVKEQLAHLKELFQKSSSSAS